MLHFVNLHVCIIHVASGNVCTCSVMVQIWEPDCDPLLVFCVRTHACVRSCARACKCMCVRMRVCGHAHQHCPMRALLRVGHSGTDIPTLLAQFSSALHLQGLQGLHVHYLLSVSSVLSACQTSQRSMSTDKPERVVARSVPHTYGALNLGPYRWQHKHLCWLNCTRAHTLRLMVVQHYGHWRR